MREKTTISTYKDQYFIYNHLHYKDLSDFTVLPDAHDAIEIIYLKRGDLSYVMEGKKYRVTKHHLILTRPGVQHFIEFNDSEKYERYDMIFDASFVTAEIYERIPADLDIIDFSDYPMINELFKRMDYYYKYYDGENYKKLLCHLIDEVFYNIGIALESSSKRLTANAYTANPLVLKAVQYIEDNLENRFTLEEMCKKLGITQSYLRQLFLLHLHTSPKKFILAKRLSLAQEMIRSGEKPTKIYFSLGFSDYSAFYRDYKKFFGYPPSEESIEKIKRVIKS